MVWTFEDDEVAMVVELNGVDIREAGEREQAVVIERDGQIDLEVSYRVKGEQPLDVDRIRMNYQLTDKHGITLPYDPEIGSSLEGEGGFTQPIDLEDYVDFRGVQVLSGIYKLQLEVDYSIRGEQEREERELSSESFYVRMAGNPLTTVMGVAATVGLAYSGFSLFTTLSQVNNWLTNVFERGVMNSRVSPTDKLKGYYEVKAANKLQNEVSSRVFSFIQDRRGEELCPSCGSEWLKEAEACPSCGLTIAEALEDFSESLEERCLDACEEVSTAVSGYSVNGLAEKLSQRAPATTSIVSLLVWSGLALAKPRVGKSMSPPTRKLVFTGLSISILSLFWLQACGINPVSIFWLAVAVLTGTFLPMIISKTLEKHVYNRVNSFWRKPQSADILSQ